VSSSPLVVSKVETADIRFPTSRLLDGSDAMNPDPDYSAAYVILRTNRYDVAGHGFAFTIGEGNDVCVAAIETLAPHVEGLRAEAMFEDMGGFARNLTGISQLRWLGPEKGVMHMATAAVINAAWDLYAKVRGVPLWKLLAGMSPEEIVALVDFRYLTDALTPDDALAILRRHDPTRAERDRELLESGYPAYTTSAGWLGYGDDQVRRLSREAVAAGFEHLKVKVGRDLEDDVRRCAIVRDAIGPERGLMVDANQVWSVPDAIPWIERLAEFDLYWVEEPTSPDDVLGHAAIARAVAPVRIATGEHVQNRIVFKQLLQANAISFVQIDACRTAGVNEAIAIMLLAARFGVPVCPHAGGVGLCELVVHLSAFDYLAVSGSLENRLIEYIDHLHEHFAEPVVVTGGRYRLPQRPGYAEILPGSLADHSFRDGAVWATA
jgi:L-fuconate dehydratase